MTGLRRSLSMSCAGIYSVSLSLIALIKAAAAQTGKPHLPGIILCIWLHYDVFLATLYEVYIYIFVAFNNFAHFEMIELDLKFA
jgi:hypothetical protein